jgi:hypothetical protein
LHVFVARRVAQSCAASGRTIVVYIFKWGL